MDYRVTFAFYDSKGRRLSVFAKFTTYNEVELFILTCSNSDHFAKKISYEHYEDYLANATLKCKPSIVKISVEEPEKELQDILIKYCRENLYSITPMEIDINVLVPSNSIYN